VKNPPLCFAAFCQNPLTACFTKVVCRCLHQTRSLGLRVQVLRVSLGNDRQRVPENMRAERTVVGEEVLRADGETAPGYSR